MVNTDDFIKRLETLLDFYGLSASSFADKIGVQRSSLSHLLSGRNKPSLDFVLKVIDTFPEVDLYWILNGKGTFPKNEKVATTPTLSKSNEDLQSDLFSETKNTEPEELKSVPNNFSQQTIISENESEIEKIVVFYKNGTFKSYLPKTN